MNSRSLPGVLPSRVRTPVSRGCRGLTLIEITITLAIIVSVMLGFCQALLGSMNASRANRETAVATDAARQMIETLQAADFEALFATNNSVAGDDPEGLPARLAAFEVPGLNPRQNDADGLCGEILLPEITEGGVSELREDLEDRALTMPRDLNGDGLIDSLDHSGDYAILPVVIRIDWRGPTGPSRVQFKTIISLF